MLSTPTAALIGEHVCVLEVATISVGPPNTCAVPQARVTLFGKMKGTQAEDEASDVLFDCANSLATHRDLGQSNGISTAAPSAVSCAQPGLSPFLKGWREGRGGRERKEGGRGIKVCAEKGRKEEGGGGREEGGEEGREEGREGGGGGREGGTEGQGGEAEKKRHVK